MRLFVVVDILSVERNEEIVKLDNNWVMSHESKGMVHLAKWGIVEAAAAQQMSNRQGRRRFNKCQMRNPVCQ